MADVNLRQAVWTRSARIAIVLVVVVAAVAAQCWLPQLDRQPAHPSHPLSTAVGSEFAVNIGHAHLTDDSASPCPPLQAGAVMPRPDTPAFEAAVVVVAGGIASMPTAAVVVAGRGPPTLPVDVRTGQDLLTRFCLSRC
ncbi:hypothetical protein C3469_11580 [Mycobacterium kansasii]|uniref:hypothetical protein n=1 Tax=Mycobacterium kansasii TaxID=1768 RepID=UPI000CDCF1B0|nr:hypothetical protein [Mycobacterium kansasii]POX89069.1 hypothetical protein C3B43_12015 [Mycobacterium kansasii]POY02331.1 hypothetical protein C3479_09380 [Mycobacterium kansasii]POY06863.1 hypothetical protein C3477_09190 [Mycobacterium kansasii]POY20492.1 hypothetical protein C3476_15190 [Mycobacterium kansasii]POY27366.1 hypothetical protein C3469_11580 [Mycobacterium kansasii]